MYRLLSLLYIGLLCVGYAVAQHTSPNMQTYLDACKAMREAVENKDFAALTDARLAFGKLRLTSFTDEDFTAVDDASASAIGKPRIFFTPDYAAELVRLGVISLDDEKDAHMMRDISGSDIKVWHATVDAGSSATFESSGSDECEMLLLGLSGSQFQLAIDCSDGTKPQTCPLDGDLSIWYGRWIMPSQGDRFRFTITNGGDSPATFVLAIN